MKVLLQELFAVSERKWVRGPLFLATMLVFTTLACSLPEVPFEPGLPGVVAPTPVGSPTPPGDTISYLVPAYARSLQPGESIPGTQLTYVGRAGDAYEVQIGGQRALKRSGDSFYWSGVIAPGVFANFNLRLTASLFGGLPVGGPVELIVLFPQPQPLAMAEEPQSQLHFGNIVIDYRVPLNMNVPGTALTYQGLEDQGLGNQTTTLARIGGLYGYPNVAVGDSLIWTGLLRENVVIRYNLRAVSFDEEAIRFVGTGELWITG